MYLNFTCICVTTDQCEIQNKIGLNSPLVYCVNTQIFQYSVPVFPVCYTSSEISLNIFHTMNVKLQDK